MVTANLEDMWLLTSRQQRLKELDECVSRTNFDNPFYVIVHAQGAFPTLEMDRRKFYRVLSEIDFVRNFEQYVELDQLTPPDVILPGIPREKPVLVGGFLGNVCVKEQRDVLRRAGYNAFICSELTYFY